MFEHDRDFGAAGDEDVSALPGKRFRDAGERVDGSVRAAPLDARDPGADLLLTAPPPAEVEEMVRNTMLTPPLAGARMLEDHGVIDWRDMLETISIPVLVCVGRYDRNAPLPAAEYVSASVPNGELVVFEHSAHAPFYEEPDRFNEVLERFIAETPESDAP